MIVYDNHHKYNENKGHKKYRALRATEERSEDHFLDVSEKQVTQITNYT